MEPPGAAPEQAFHELLVRLAGRLPDALLWRLRDWLPSSPTVVASLLPRELLRHRVGLTDDEHDLLVASAGACGAPQRLLDAVLPLHTPDETTAVFGSGPDVVDQVLLSVLAVVRGHPGCTGLRQAWRPAGTVRSGS